MTPPPPRESATPRRVPTALIAAAGIIASITIGGLLGYSSRVTPDPASEPSGLPAASRYPGPGQTATLAPLPSDVPTVYHVAKGGADSAAGSEADPWRTIQHAVDVAPPGSAILVHDGTFKPFAITRSGLTVAGAPGETAVIAGTTGTQYVIHVEGASNVTIRDLTVRGADVTFGSGIRVDGGSRVSVVRTTVRDNRSFGIKVKDSTDSLIVGNDIFKNETGIELSGKVDGATITDNAIHENDRMVTPTRGGNAVVFATTTGPIAVTGNRLWGNRARHLHDKGYDGGAFEVYASSDLTISDNVVWDNNNVMETGTDGSAPCDRIVFTRNVVYGAGKVPHQTEGMILRCASHSTVAQNTFDGLDTYAFYVATKRDFAGSIVGLRIENNIVVRGRTYSLTRGIPRSVVIDHNLSRPGGTRADYGNYLAYVEGRGNTDLLGEFRAWTGYDRHGLVADPRFADQRARDYHLRAGSPAIDRGAVVVRDGYDGRAPDLGRYEVLR
jgi:parallel beta-helix repeat protein